ncbi:MAG: nuclease-related domain-containing protein, partial [Akkermansiaceae bacterium]
LNNWPGLTCLLGIFVLFKIYSSPTFKGWFGEKMALRGLRKFNPAQYRVFHDLYLPHPSEEGTTQIDHVVVSPFGIFVVETKNYRGWIFGSEKQPQWTQQIFRKKHKFQNPLHQNKLHVKALMQFLNLPEDHFHSVVLFIGNTEFKTEMPVNVLNGGLVRWIKSHADPRIDAPTVEQAVSQLSELDRTTNRGTASCEHLKALKARHGSL